MIDVRELLVSRRMVSPNVESSVCFWPKAADHEDLL